jgi:hypothetical protein
MQDLFLKSRIVAVMFPNFKALPIENEQQKCYNAKKPQRERVLFSEEVLDTKKPRQALVCHPKWIN